MLKSLLAPSEFLKNVMTLMTGTTIAQALPIIISPILTRLYTPEEFGLLALFIALASLVNVISTGRYELAIIQPKDDEDVNSLTQLSMICSVIISLVLFILILIFSDNIANTLGNFAIKKWLWLIPFSVLLFGVYQSLNYWNNRYKAYVDISKAKVQQSVANVTSNLVLSPLQESAVGLISGYVVGQVIAVIKLTKKILTDVPNFFKKIDFSRSKKLAVEYRNFPLLSAPGALLNSASLQMPVFFLTKFFDLTTVGFFNFVYRIIGSPLALISGALSQVLLQHVATAESNEIYSFIKSTAVKLFVISLPFVVIIFFFGEVIFSFVFGEAWAIAGSYSKILIFSIAIRFIVSPLSMVLALNQNVKIAFIWQVLSFISVLTILNIFKELNVSVFLYAFVIQDVLVYLIYLGFILYGAKNFDNVKNL